MIRTNRTARLYRVVAHLIAAVLLLLRQRPQGGVPRARDLRHGPSDALPSGAQSLQRGRVRPPEDLRNR